MQFSKIITSLCFLFFLAVPSLTFTAEAQVANVFDIDGNGETEPLSDGLLTLRYQFGFRGESLISQAIGVGATRTTASQIETYLNVHSTELDIDGNGKTEPLSDGLLLLRYLFGFRGDSLINQAVAGDATRKTAGEIEGFLKKNQSVNPIFIESKDLIETTEKFYPTLINAPENATVEWFVDNVSVPSIQGSQFNVAGNHVVKAKIYLAGVLLAEVDKRILVTRNREKGSFVAKTNALSTYYQEDNNNDKMAGFQLDIPAGALVSEKTITIEEASLSDKFPNLFAISLKPHGLTFTKPVKVTMPYDQSYRDEPIQIIRYSENGETTKLPILSRDNTNHLVTFLTDHFSTYSATKGFFGGDGDDFEEIKTRINWQGTDEELESILDFKPQGDSVSTTVFNYYLLDKQNKAIDKGSPYASYTQFFPEQGINPVWGDVKKGLNAISIITSTDDSLKSVIASTVSYVSGKPVPGGLSDVTSWAKTGAKAAFNSYNPIDFGESILNFGNEIFWNYQLTQYFLKRPTCVFNENISPPCQIYDTDVDVPTLSGFYKGYTDNLNGFSDIKNMSPEEKKLFWEKAEALYQSYLLGTNNDDKLKDMVLAVQTHLQFLKDSNTPSAITHVEFEMLQEQGFYQSKKYKPIYRDIPTTLKVGFYVSGLNNPTHVSLARYIGIFSDSNNTLKDHYESIQTQQNCGVSNDCSFTFSPENLGENLQYRIVSNFSNPNIDTVIHDFTLSVIEQYEIVNLEVTSINKLGVENGVEQYDLTINPIFHNVENQVVNQLDEYDCKVVMDVIKRITKSCNDKHLKLSKDFIHNLNYRNEKLTFIFNEQSEAYDIKDARLTGDSSNSLINKGDVYVEVDLNTIEDQITSDSIPVVTISPALIITKVNGTPITSKNITLHVGDTVEFEVSGGKDISWTDFDGNGRFSSHSSSPELQELEENIRYVQTFNRTGTFRPAFKFNNINEEKTVLLEGSILVNEQNPDLPTPLEISSSYVINSENVVLSVSANKNLETIEWTQIRGINVDLQPTRNSQSPSFDIPVLQGEKEKFSFSVEVSTLEGERTEQLVSFELSLLTSLTLSQPQNVQAIEGDKQVTLSWDAVTHATGYNICMATETITNPANCASHQGGTLLLDNTSPAVITTLSNDTEFFFVVIPKNINGDGEPSSVVSATPTGAVAPTPTGKLNDTGITHCADDSFNNLACPVSTHPNQDAQSGRDVTHNDDSDGHAGFSFTKISSTGAELPAFANEWSCVKDNVTGLIWEVKTTDGGLHDKNNTYTWYNSDNTANGDGAGTENGKYDTDSFVSDVNSATLCNSVNWRMPTRKELSSLVDYSVAFPGTTIDTDYFPNTLDAAYWSSSPHVYINYSNRAWSIYFYHGHAGDISKSSKLPVRLVSNRQ